MASGPIAGYIPTSMRGARLSLFFFSLALAACREGGDVEPAPRDAGFADAAEPPDAGHAEDAGATDAGPPRPPDVCDALGLRRLPFSPGAETSLFGDLAGDFTVTELDGAPWVFSERFTGCESYVFLGFIPTSSSFEEQLFDSRVEPLIYETPLNSHFFFLSFERTEEARRARLEPLKARVDRALEGAFADDEERARQAARFHFVADLPREIPGSLGAFYRDYSLYAADPDSAVDLGDRGRAPPPLPYALAIDRDQRWDAGESLAQFVGGRPAFGMAGFLPLFFDHKARLRDQQAEETGVTRVTLLDETTTGRVFVKAAELPPAAAMAGFDALEFDVRVVCRHRNVFGCSEWDRIALVERCADESCTASQELVRWITPYWRRGEQRWVIDASALLPLVDAGGRQWFRITLGPEWERPTEWEVEVVLRLSRQGRPERPRGWVPAFLGGDFDERYGQRAPVTFTPPASATKVELVTILSGHGEADGTRCAEWCDHRHRFTLNGVALPEVRHEGRVGSISGCGPAAARGAPPGQWGNWAPERAYWCPGLPVEHRRIDLTAAVRLGQPNELTYAAGLGGGGPGGGYIALSSYVVWSE
jgi:hypothetical protein